MAEMITKADAWFVNFVALGGAVYFLWSMRGILSDLKAEIADLKAVIKEIFDRNNDHERRISRIEGICKGRRNNDGPANCGE